jgi:hypothetical protein
MDMKVVFPRNAIEWQQYVSSMQQQRKANLTNQQSFNPKQGTLIRETRPVAPAASSKNWSESLWKGYQTSDDLSTYIIPRHEQLKLALFSRYILKDPNAANNEYLTRAQERFAQRQPYKSVKEYVASKKTDFGGQTIMNPSMVTNDGTEIEDNLESNPLVNWALPKHSLQTNPLVSWALPSY